jgi:hypothetical protein
MIEFPCQCGYRFRIPDDRAGASLQCPKCRRLNDVPTLSDLPAIKPDGTYLIDEPPKEKRNRFAEFARAYGRRSVDEDGNEKDLRLTIDDIRRATGLPPEAHAPSTPKYDPVTGELIRPMGVSSTDAQDAIPVAKTAIGYAMPGVNPRISPGAVLLALFAPTNAFVMVFIVLFHLVIQGSLAIIGFAFPVFAVFGLTFCILAHYGCVVQEIGPEEKDELPRPLRSLSWGDDLWGPFWAVVASLVLCYTPGIIALLRLGIAPRGLFLSGSLAALGTIVFPAILLTQTTSGHAANVRPDRVLGVIRQIGWSYPLLVVFWLLALGAYVVGIWRLELMTLGMMWGSTTKIFWMLAFVTVMAAVYLMHFFCWQLGLHYRAKHFYFPWILQRHIKRTEKEKVAIHQAAKAARLRNSRESS